MISCDYDENVMFDYWMFCCVIVYLEPAQIHGSQLRQPGNGNIVKYLVQIQSDPRPQGAQLLQYHRREQHLDSRPATS